MIIWIGVSVGFMFTNQLFFMVLDNVKIEFPNPN